MMKVKWTLQWLFVSIILGLDYLQKISATPNEGAVSYIPALECYDPYGKPQRCIPEFVNAAYDRRMEATNTCGESGPQEYCIQTGYSNRKSCDNICNQGDHSSVFLTDLHEPQRQTWWQSETMLEGIQHPNQVNLTLHLGKSFDITYIRIVYYSPRPESFAIYKRQTTNGSWIPYQYYSATCRDTYGLPDSLSEFRTGKKGESESRAFCTSEYSDISPLRDGNVAFSTLEGRPSAYNFEHSLELQNWVTATDIRISLDRLNTFGDEVFGDPQVLKSYFYAIADVAIGARCKCNGHSDKCVVGTGLNGERSWVCECKHYTDGQDCEKCLPFYNDAPWGRATSKNVHECKPCNCNGYSQKCFFDKALFNLTGHGGHCIDCAANRDGPNCERCKENYYMRSDGFCINCDCDPTGSRSLQCNSEGKCQCKPGVTGEKCDRCEANYFAFGEHGCQPCGCDPRGSLDNIPSCDPETGYCSCKENVEGKRCKECKPGFFSLDLENKFGCTPCFCYGHTSECQSAPGYSIVSTTSGFNKHKEKWTAVDEYNNPVDLKYNQFSNSIGTTARGNEHIYFLAPERFLGDQRASYNRLLKFRLQLVGQVGPNPSPTDVILEGAGTKISLPIFAQGHSLPNQETREYAFRLHENSEYSWQPSQSSRGFISILSNLTAIKIRATYSTHGEAFLDDVELQTANRGTAGRPATWIEQCTCPEGYIGQFCESCAPGYRHSPARGGPFMPCIPCDCNKHADICDSETGRCICQHNTAGDNCDQCARGYYGNALNGTTYDCKRCPCPDNGACMQMADESVICLECPIGYFGSRCELCSDGYYGDPTGLLGPVQLCQACECNGNVDPNAVGNCNRTTGECSKCVYNTGGSHCEQCLPGHFGDPLSLPHGNCEQCSCYLPGTEQTEDGISVCDSLTGNCRCKPNVIGRNCNECQNGYYNIVSGNGCESCNCDPIGSFNSSCERSTGQCYCKPGVTGLRCDQCSSYQYGFSPEGCKPCDCDESGSKGFQCDASGQCPCNDNVEGRRCDRCKENKYNRHQGCLDCPDCYNLVRDAANDHRRKLADLKSILQQIASNPTVIDDAEFEAKLKAVEDKINILAEDAKSGAGGGDRTLVERIDDLRERLNNVQKLLDESDSLKDTTAQEIELASLNVSKAESTIANARKTLDEASELLNTDGATALARAKDRFDQFGQQSEQISEISREARAQVDLLEKQADQSKQNAVDANEKASKAYELARNALSQQQQISDELRTNIRSEIEESKIALENAIGLSNDALQQANQVYDEALTLIANINALSVPDINLEKLRTDAIKAIQEAERLQAEIDRLTSEHDALLVEYDENSDHGSVLVERLITQQDDAIKLLEHLHFINKNAKEAVALGDGTLKEANDTYQTLTGFQTQVQQSSESAKLVLETVPDIENQIREVDSVVGEAENALQGARSNAEEARLNAHEAQEKYAEQASQDADIIRRKANETKAAAHQLRGEADHLNGRVVVTENRIAKLSDAVKEDNALTDEAKEKVGQAKSDSEESTAQVEKALNEVRAIMDELKSLRDINLDELDALEKRLTAAEAEVNRANLTDRLADLDRVKNEQNLSIKSYQNEVSQLESEVNNIKLISEALPNDCFKQPRLEP